MLENHQDAPETTLPAPQKVVLTTSEAAAFLGLAISTLNKWRCYGEGPQFIKLGRAVRYRQDDLEHYVETNTQTSTCVPRTRESNNAR